jgi:acyl-coenzyme A thioesterase PaaI-like protein
VATFLGAGIKITEISGDFRRVSVKLKFRWWNKNANRSHFGGSIFSMTDSIYSLMLMRILKEQYFVWDREASINFVKPGMSDLQADFTICQEQLDDIRAQTVLGDKHFREFITHLKDQEGQVVATIERKLHVRRKPKYREQEEVDSLERKTSLS